MTGPATFRTDRRAVASIDFAVAIATVILLVAAILDLGNLLAAQHSLDFGVIKAARYAAVNSKTASPTTIKAAFTTAVTPTLGVSGALMCNVSISYPTTNAVGNTITISATYGWAPASLIDGLLNISLSAQQTLTIIH